MTEAKLENVSNKIGEAPKPIKQPTMDEKVDKLLDEVAVVKRQQLEVVKLLNEVITTRNSEVEVFNNVIEVVKSNQDYMLRTEKRVKETLEIVHKNQLDISKAAGVASGNTKDIAKLNKAIIGQESINNKLSEGIADTVKQTEELGDTLDHFNTSFAEYKKATDDKIDTIGESLSVLDRVKKVFGK